MKVVVRGLLISIGYKEKRVKQSCIASLSVEIRGLEILHKLTCSKQIYKKLLAKRKALEAIDTRNIQHDLLFVKHKFWKKSPQNLRILAWRVKKQRALRQIFALRDTSGLVATKSEDIMDILKKFYSSLYKEKPTDPCRISQFLEASPLEPLSVEHKLFLDKPITAQ